MSQTCAKCHQLGNGCCFIKNPDLQIGLFESDIIRIAAYLDLDRQHFIEIDRINNDLQEFLSRSIHPIFDKMFPNNVRHKLKTIGERCGLLTDTGCQLPTEIRPIYCQVYPFFPSYDNKHINVLSSGECLAQAESVLNWQIVNQHFGYTEEYLRGLFSQLVSG